MLYLLRVFFRDPWIILPLVFSGLAQSFNWWYIIAHLQERSDHYFLHYNIVFGVDLVGDWQRIFYIPIGGLLILLVNYGLALAMYNNERAFSRLLAVFGAILQIFLCLAAFLIVDLNI